MELKYTNPLYSAAKLACVEMSGDDRRYDLQVFDHPVEGEDARREYVILKYRLDESEIDFHNLKGDITYLLNMAVEHNGSAWVHSSDHPVCSTLKRVWVELIFSSLLGGVDKFGRVKREERLAELDAK
jgi:hypothetical protein